jgi:hypothetical protein
MVEAEKWLGLFVCAPSGPLECPIEHSRLFS